MKCGDDGGSGGHTDPRHVNIRRATCSLARALSHRTEIRSYFLKVTAHLFQFKGILTLFLGFCLVRCYFYYFLHWMSDAIIHNSGLRLLLFIYILIYFRFVTLSSTYYDGSMEWSRDDCVDRFKFSKFDTKWNRQCDGLYIIDSLRPQS